MFTQSTHAEKIFISWTHHSCFSFSIRFLLSYLKLFSLTQASKGNLLRHWDEVVNFAAKLLISIKISWFFSIAAKLRQKSLLSLKWLSLKHDSQKHRRILFCALTPSAAVANSMEEPLQTLDWYLWPFALEPQDYNLYLQTEYIYCKMYWLLLKTKLNFHAVLTSSIIHNIVIEFSRISPKTVTSIFTASYVILN